MNRFSIKDIETITGIKSHTLRIWEQRYGFFETKRSESNIRYYNDDDLRFFLNISILNDQGHKISNIAKMSKDDIAKMVEQTTAQFGDYESNIQQIVKATLALDEKAFKKQWQLAVKTLGFEQTIIKIIYPFLGKVGIMWQTGSICPAQEHFASNLIKQGLIVAIDGLKVSTTKSSKKCLMFLPEREYHEIALLFTYYLIKSRGHQVLYLGQNLSVKYVKEIHKTYHPDFIFSIVTSGYTKEEVLGLLDSFHEYFPDNKVLLTGNAIRTYNIKHQKNIKALAEVSDLLAFMSDLELT